MKKFIFLALMLMTLLTGTKSMSQAIDPFVGQIALVGFTFAPRGWAVCDGSLLSIANDQALFALIGTTYGGDGVTTFALPDLRGRVPMGQGNGVGLTPAIQGEMKGTETNIISVAQMPSHNHTVNAVLAEGNQNTPTNNFPADTKLLDKEYANGIGNTTMNPQMIENRGGNQPVNNMQPSLTMMYIIALQGVFPARN